MLRTDVTFPTKWSELKCFMISIIHQFKSQAVHVPSHTVLIPAYQLSIVQYCKYCYCTGCWSSLTWYRSKMCCLKLKKLLWLLIFCHFLPFDPDLEGATYFIRALIVVERRVIYFLAMMLAELDPVVNSLHFREKCHNELPLGSRLYLDK